MIGIFRGGRPQLKEPHLKHATLQVHYFQLPAQLPVITQPAPIAYLSLRKPPYLLPERLSGWKSVRA